MATIGLTLVGIIFFLGRYEGSIEYAVPAFTGVRIGCSTVNGHPSMFVGFDVIPQSAEEMKHPAQTDSRGSYCFYLHGSRLVYLNDIRNFTLCAS